MLPSNQLLMFGIFYIDQRPKSVGKVVPQAMISQTNPQGKYAYKSE